MQSNSIQKQSKELLCMQLFVLQTLPGESLQWRAVSISPVSHDHIDEVKSFRSRLPVIQSGLEKRYQKHVFTRGEKLRKLSLGQIRKRKNS